MTTRRDLLTRLSRAVEPLYGVREAALIARMVVAEKGGISESSLLVEPDLELHVEGFDALVEELAAGRPVQYVLGHAEFCGLDFCVREGVLIPRPETEELVMHILEECPSARRILDVGTGSGCIALALKSRLPEAMLTAVDISEEALAIARENSRQLGLEVDFRGADALALESDFPTEAFDVVVSNPPYIPQSELAEMRRNVTHYEPHGALFVPDDDPLRFYRAIARSARRLLADGGSLWFEIHERYAGEMIAMLHDEGYADNRLLYDINQKPRMTWSRK